jgi:glutaminase
MKVRDLIEKLQDFGPELLVICCTENEADLDSGDLTKCFEIQGISKHVCTPTREEGRVTVALGKGKEARPVVFIELD